MNTVPGQNGSVKRAVIATTVFFDMFSYPLTALEIYKWLYFKNRTTNQPSFNEVTRSIEQLQQRGKLLYANGFYFLPGRKSLVKLRIKRHNLAQSRFIKVQRFARIIQIVPFVEMVAACNTLAIYDIKSDSDIDVFIIVRHGRLWFTRFWVTVFAWIAGVWRHGGKVTNQICLSFFVCDNTLNLKSIAKQFDIYLTYWINLVIPVFDKGMFHKFVKENNWIKDYLPNSYPYKTIPKRRQIEPLWCVKWIDKIREPILGGRFGNLVEKFFRSFQKKKMRKRTMSLEAGSTDVIISEDMLKFHEVDKRNEFQKKWEEKMSDIHV